MVYPAAKCEQYISGLRRAALICYRIVVIQCSQVGGARHASACQVRAGARLAHGLAEYLIGNQQ